jgi:formylglycine-generating enzyme required for sulfatase activity
MSEAPATVEDQASTKTILVPDIDWATIPAGEFIYGEDETQTTLYLDAFDISRYPVTNAQYQCFIDDDGYEDNQWWQGLEKQTVEPSNWPQGNRPKVNVSWYEATAFTRWLSSRLNDHIRLPLEQEWEKAARGEKGLVYPWGNTYEIGHANLDESQQKGGAYLQQTTAVGLYPSGESPDKVSDLSGNVWEWCNENLSELGKSGFDASSTPVLCGGSWGVNPPFVRAANRFRRNPDYRIDSFGFRLLRTSISPDISQSWNSWGGWNSWRG